MIETKLLSSARFWKKMTIVFTASLGRYHAPLMPGVSLLAMTMLPTVPTRQRVARSRMTTARAWLIWRSSVDDLVGGLRAPCITLVSTPVLMTRPSTHSVLRTDEPRIRTLAMVMGATDPMPSMRRCASASLELRCRLPANLLVAALGCSHSMWPEQRSKALSCASTVAEGASLDMTEVSTEGDCFPLRFVSPSSPLVSTWQEPRGMAGSGSCAASMSTSAGTAWWLEMRMTSPTLMSVQTESRRVAPRLHCAGELLASLSALWRARSSMSLSAALAQTMMVRIGASVGTPLVLLTMGMHWRAVIVRKYMYGSLENSSNRILGAKFHQE
mmetsp:Transcript_1841/g.4084  ORF Transcript_1841/g.4084 Transcript_1841/m.4084 type:complete len:329 (-) Transcript_1841:199-1185(-)